MVTAYEGTVALGRERRCYMFSGAGAPCASAPGIGEERVSIDRRRRRTAVPTTSSEVPAARETVAVPLVEGPPPSPEALEFVRFCHRRSGVSWPELYDEMCATAARGTYRGLDYESLATFGISFALTEMPRLAAMAHRVVDEERATRTPVIRVALAG